MLKKRTAPATAPTRNSPAAPAKKSNTDFTSVLDKIKPVSSLGLVLAALFYGRAGTGKTTVSATFPKPVLHLDIREKGTDSISDMEDVDTIQINSWDDFEGVYWYLASDQNKYRTVVIDAVSQLQDFAVEQAMLDDKKEIGELVTKRQWGQAAGKLKTWMINYRDLVDSDINVVFLAHDRTRDGEESEDGEMSPTVGPRLMPSVASVLTASVKLIGNTFIRETHEKSPSGKMIRKVEYCMRIGPHAFYETKIRQPKGSFTPGVIANPDYNVLVSLMKGEIEPEPEPAPSTTGKKLLKRTK